FNFENEQKQLYWVTCSGCHEKHLSCVTTDCVHKKRCKSFQGGNDMDPGEVPEELKDLTFIEEQLIARVHPLISAFKLKGLQYGYSGNVINFPQNVAEFVKKLPHRIEDLPSVLTIRYKNEFCKPKLFTVRSAVVFRALVFLKKYNPFYSDIDICQENIDLLPADGNVLEQIAGLVREDNDNVAENFNKQKSDSLNEEMNESERLYHSGIPLVRVASNEQEVESNLYEWPVLGETPVNEFDTPGYIPTAFPKLFPCGKADMKSPRSQKIYPAEYFQHLLDYKDGRFAKHETFRFFAMNSLMRWNSCTNGSIFVRNHPEFKDITISELKDLLKKNRLLMKKIMLQSSSLRGSKQYWSARAGELTDMCEQLGLPTVFLTLSCADLHWVELYRLLTGLDDVSELREKERRDLLQQNPYIVDSFFHQRVQSFIKSVLSVEYPVKDYWYRIEYQHRGSPHMHGVFWFEDAPDVSNIKTANEEELKHICDYFDKLISAVNPNPRTENSAVHPSRLLYSDVRGNFESEEEDLAQLCVRLQRHTICSTNYCLKGKKGGPKKCRFNFPQELREISCIEFDENGEPRFVPARNDPLLNKLCKILIRWWRANLDISPVLSLNNLLHYLSKYISKSETRSKSLAELFQNVFEDLNQTDSVLKFIRRLYIRSFSERDFSAQEVCHILSGRYLYTAGKRKFLHVNLNRDTMWKKVQTKSSKETPSQTVVEKYIKRPLHLEDVSLWEFAKTRDVTRKGYPKKQIENIVQVYPRTKLEAGNNNNEIFFRCQVLLHLPWRSENGFLDQNLTWKEIYENGNIDKVFDKTTDLRKIQANELSESSDSDTEDETNENLEEFMVLSRIGPKKNVPDVELGLRESDVSYDWSKSIQKYKQYGSLEELSKFIGKMKRELKEDYDIDDFNCNDYQYSEEQMAVIEQVHEQISAIQNQTSAKTGPKKFTIVQGKAGTGKSVLIRYLKWKVETSLNKPGSVLLLAPTGVTALNIRGQTIHSALHMPKERNFFNQLSGGALNKFCGEMENVQFLVCDEYSMIGAAMLRFIDLRCRQGKGIDEIFGGLYVYLFGDIRQLPPVMDTPLYRAPKTNTYAEQGMGLVHCLEKVFFLKKCFRQQDQHFVDILDRISIGEATLADYKILTTRFTYTDEVNEDFKNALRLFSTKRQVTEFNYTSLQSLKCIETLKNAPVVKINAQHNCKTAIKGTPDQAEGLHAVLHLGLKCKIMLIHNMWTSKGLCNGAIGFIEDILYQNDENPLTAFPKVIMCKFENSTGPGIGPMNLVPITPICKYWETGLVQCSRLQFPIVVCYSCSIHKFQGLSLDKSITDIGNDEFALGITYVALSRAKSINGLKLVPFSFERLAKLKNHQDMKRKLDFEKFLKTKM
ncbi:ATP-dependent DNA helicase, partial [Frankliniella fusca]